MKYRVSAISIGSRYDGRGPESFTFDLPKSCAMARIRHVAIEAACLCCQVEASLVDGACCDRAWRSAPFCPAWWRRSRAPWRGLTHHRDRAGRQFGGADPLEQEAPVAPALSAATTFSSSSEPVNTMIWTEGTLEVTVWAASMASPGTVMSSSMTSGLLALAMRQASLRWPAASSRRCQSP